jgi:hypothetical protein
MKQDGTTRKNDDKAPKPEPAGDRKAAPLRREVRMESDEGTPEEAGYGYGV